MYGINTFTKMVNMLNISLTQPACPFFNRQRGHSETSKTPPYILCYNQVQTNRIKTILDRTLIMINKEFFGKTADGKAVFRYTLKNSHGMCIRILDYGCIIQNIFVPDRNGLIVDVALGYDDLAGYEAGSSLFGAFVGRYANRIKGARFTLGGKTYQLEKNDGKNHIHGVYPRQIFDGQTEGNSLVLRRISPDGEGGYPGTLSVEVRYTLTEDDSLEIEYTASTDADTVINLTNHTYFNLNGDGSDVLGHFLQLDCDRYTEADEEAIPTGQIFPVEGTPMDFREGKTIGQDLFSDWPPLAMARGYNHNFIIDKDPGTLQKFAECQGDLSGITLEAFTTQPAVQFYTGNFVAGDLAPFGKNHIRYPNYAGFCLETQHYPCTPNFPEFPSTILRPGEEFREKTIYRFKAE